jgi:uncharacterized protein
MKFAFTHVIHLSRQVVWKWIKSADVIQHSIKGCQSFVETKSGMYQGKINVQWGPIKDEFSIVVKRVKENKPESYLIKVKGKGNLGEVEGEINLSLEDIGNSTKMIFSADVQFRGPILLAAERITNSDANRLVEPFLQQLEKEIKRAIYLARKRG